MIETSQKLTIQYIRGPYKRARLYSTSFEKNEQPCNPSLEIFGFRVADAIVQVDSERADSVENVLHARRVELYPGLPEHLDVVGDGVRLGVVQQQVSLGEAVRQDMQVAFGAGFAVTLVSREHLVQQNRNLKLLQTEAANCQEGFVS